MPANRSSRALALDIQGLTRSFGHHRALKGVDLQVEPEECLAVFGPNGAGKTTLIKVLATIMRPSSGQITVDGLELRANAEDIRRRIGVVTHQTFLYANLTAYENLEFYARLYDVPRHKERIQQLAAQVGMTSRLHDRVGTLSRGMQQRVSLARSVLHDPEIMLLDEPEAALDQEGVAMLWEMLRAGRERKRAVLVVTHNLERGLAICDSLVILDRGSVAYQSSHAAMDLAGLKEIYRESTGMGA